MELAFVGRLLAACVVIGIVLAGVQFVARRAMRVRFEGGGGRLVTLLETTYLPGAASVHVLRIAGSYVVVGRGGGDLSRICEIAPEHVEAYLATSHASRADGGATAMPAFARRLFGRIR